MKNTAKKANKTAQTTAKTALCAPRTQGSKWIRQDKRLAIYLRDGLACAYCGVGIESGAQLSLDHLTCYSHGGSNHESNLVTCCSHCNSARGDRPVQEFAEKVAGYINVDPSEILGYIENQVKKDLKQYRIEAKAMIIRRGSYGNVMNELRYSQE